MTDARSRPVRILAPALVAFLAMLALPACEDDAAGGVYTEMLRLTPDLRVVNIAPAPDDSTDEWVFVGMGDIARYRELAGTEPDGNLDSQAYIEMLEAAGDVPFPGLGFIVPSWMEQFSAYSDMTRRTLGVGVADVDQWLRTSTVFGQFAIRGDFDEDRVEGLLANCAECPPAQTFEHHGTTVYAWGDDMELSANRLVPPIFDDIGRGCCLALQDHYILRSYTRAGVTSMLDAQAGVDSLADDDDFRLAAEVLDTLGTLNAGITDFTWDRAQAPTGEGSPPGDASIPAEQIEKMREAWDIAPDTVLLRPYLVFASGVGYADGEPFLAVVLVHDSEDEAQANEERLRRRLEDAVILYPPEAPSQTWAERYERVEVEVDGRVLRARLWGDAPEWTTPNEPAFVHE